MNQGPTTLQKVEDKVRGNNVNSGEVKSQLKQDLKEKQEIISQKLHGSTLTS